MDRQIVTVFYNDTPSTVSKLIGELIGDLKGKIVSVKTRNKGEVNIPLSKIVRIEEGGDYK